MKRCVIIGGAGITRYDRVSRFLREDDFGIFCDCGLRHLTLLQVKPGLIVGDFDSHEKPDTDAETIVLPREKDDTDTFFAVKEAVRRGYDDFLLIGVIGERMDHTLANLSILQYLDAAGKSAPEIRDMLAYLQFINNPNDMLRFRRIINEPKRGIGDSTLALIEDISRDLKLSPYDVLRTCDEYAPLSKKLTPLRNAAELFGFLMEKREELPLDEFFDLLLDKTGYMDYLKTLENPDTKIENVQELRSSIVQYMNENDEPDLSGFLEEVALYSEADRDNSTDDRVTLMTVHSAKGLEYENVFVIGLDDGIFPSSRSFDSEEDMEEERRLAYVAITRAKKKLYLTNARQRMIFGQTQHNVTSRFMREIGSELVEKHDNAAAMKNRLAQEEKTVTAVHSATLQQQLARNKMHAGSAAAKESVTYTAGEKVLAQRR